MKFGSPAITFVFHVGAHATDDDLLVRSLLKDGVRLQERRVIVPRPRHYRKLVRDHLNTYRGDVIPEDVQQALFDDLMKDHEADRVILSDQDYLTMPRAVFENRQLYSKAGFRSVWLRYLFPENPCEFFLSIRNPATYIPAMLARNDTPEYEGFVNDTDPRRMRWSSVVERIQKNNPGCPITVWSNEDTPLVWPQVLREISGLEMDYALDGDLDVLRAIMRPEGITKLEKFLETQPPQSELQRRRILSAFLTKYAVEEELVEEIDLPGWTPELVDEVTALYEEDIETIEQMAGVTFLSP